MYTATTSGCAKRSLQVEIVFVFLRFAKKNVVFFNFCSFMFFPILS